MFLFTLSIILVLAGVVTACLTRFGESRAASILVGLILIVFGATAFVTSTALYVHDNQGGIVVKKFGPDLSPGQIIATKGEKGPQAVVLTPGWHLWFMPYLYELTSVDNINIPAGNIGVVMARDGKPLPSGEVFAAEWPSYTDMLDGEKFLSGAGQRGPQLTVLPPGMYRYNPRLFDITTRKILEVSIGSVAVIKANAGMAFTGEVKNINGTPIVPKGYRGIWATPLTPNAYYMNPDAYVVTMVQTTARIYDYSDQGSSNIVRSIMTRTKDGFSFPVEMRVSCNISAESAPMVVALIGPPDELDPKTGFTLLEERAILPSLRTIIRNTAETRNALDYMSTRQEIGVAATMSLKESLTTFKVDVKDVFIANIGLDHTDAGKELMSTQTKREIANQESIMYSKQMEAQSNRQQLVRATAEADQQSNVVKATIGLEVAKLTADTLLENARGEAGAKQLMINAMGSPMNTILSTFAAGIAEKWNGSVPQIVVSGGGSGGSNDSMVSALLGQLLQNNAAQATNLVTKNAAVPSIEKSK